MIKDPLILTDLSNARTVDYSGGFIYYLINGEHF